MAWRRAFSTLGCAGTPLADVVRVARAGCWTGVELRAAPDEPVHTGLSSDERRAVRRLLENGGIVPLAIASYVEVDDPGRDDDDVVHDLLRHVRLASDLGAPFVRVFPGGPSNDGAAARRLVAAAQLLPDDAVSIAVETHDTCARGSDVRRLLDAVGDPRVRAVWDIQHPWRAGESVRETFDALRPLLAYVQITDATSLDDPTPPRFGDGVLPLREVYDVLRRERYDGWISLEWASYWYPAAAPFAGALRAASHWFTGALWDSRALAGPGPV